MNSIEDYRSYFESMTVVAPLNFTFNKPMELLEKLKELSELPYFVRRSDFFPKMKDGNREPKNFKGWVVAYGINKRMNTHFKEWRAVHTYLRSGNYGADSFHFSKHFVQIFGLKPLMPLQYFNTYLHGEATLKKAAKESEFYINQKRGELKEVLGKFGSNQAIYYNINNSEIFFIIYDETLTQQEKIKKLKEDFHVKKYSIKTLSNTKHEAFKETIFIDDFENINS